MRKASRVFMCMILMLLAVPMVSFMPAQEKAVKAETPVLLTSCGQSPGPVRLRVFLKQLNIDFTENLLVTAQDLIAKSKEGKPYKSVIIVTGASLKGMGAAGVSLNDELDRIKKLIEEARKQKIMIIGAHIEGMARRAQGADAGDTSDEQSIDAVCPQSQILLIRKDGDADSRFTAISKSKNIPMIAFEKNLDIGNVLKDLFGK